MNITCTMGCSCQKVIRRDIPVLLQDGKQQRRQMDDCVVLGAKFLSKIRHTAFTKANYNPSSYDVTPLTSNQKEIIRESWRMIYEGPDILKNSAYAFVRMFVLEPESMVAFNFLNVDTSQANIDEKVLLANSVMKNHLTFVVDFLNEIVQMLDDWAAIEKKSRELGQRHRGYGARVEYLKAICEGFLFAFEKSLWPDVDVHVIQAWESLFLHLAKYWATGFEKPMPVTGELNNSSKREERDKQMVARKFEEFWGDSQASSSV